MIIFIKISTYYLTTKSRHSIFFGSNNNNINNNNFNDNKNSNNYKNVYTILNLKISIDNLHETRIKR